MKSEAYIKIECNDCHDELEIGLTALAINTCWDERNVPRHVERNGWEWVDEDEQYCMECKTKHEEEEESEDTSEED